MPMRSPERHCSIPARRRGSASSRRGDLIRGVCFCFVLFLLDSGHEFRHIVIALRGDALSGLPLSLELAARSTPAAASHPANRLPGFSFMEYGALIEPTTPAIASIVSQLSAKTTAWHDPGTGSTAPASPRRS